MATVRVASNSTYTVETLYQWDHGQTLEVYGLSLPSAPELRFAHKGAERAIVRVASMDAAGVVRAEIPNSLLQKAYTIQVWVGLYEGDAFKTHYKLEIPVKEQAKPLDYTLEDDPEVYSFERLEAQVASMEHVVEAQALAVEQQVSAAMQQSSETQAAAEAAAAAAASATEELARAEEMLSSSSILTLTHKLTGSTHALTGLGSASGLVYAQFKATAAFTEGDSLTIDGLTYVARTTNGETLETGFWALGATVGCIIDTEDLRVNFKGGGGVKLPALTKPATAAQILTGYQAINGEGVLMEGTAGKTITKPATAAKIQTGYQAMLADGTVLTGTSGAAYAVQTGSLPLQSESSVSVPGTILAVTCYLSNGSYSGGTGTPGQYAVMTVAYSASNVVMTCKGKIYFSGKTFTYYGSTSDGVSGNTVEYKIIYAV